MWHIYNIFWNVLSNVWLFSTLWTVFYQVPLSTGLFRQEYWNGLPFPPPGDLPDRGTKTASPVSPALQGILYSLREYFNVFHSAAAAKLLQSCLTVCDPIEPTRFPRPWDSPGKNINGASQEALVVKNQSANVGHIRDGFETWVGKIP